MTFAPFRIRVEPLNYVLERVHAPRVAQSGPRKGEVIEPKPTLVGYFPDLGTALSRVRREALREALPAVVEEAEQVLAAVAVSEAAQATISADPTQGSTEGLSASEGRTESEDTCKS